MLHSKSAILKELEDHGESALARLFDEQRETLRSQLSKRINGRLASRFDESDIIQETFIRANKQLKKYLRETKVPPIVWLRILCRQVLAENVRKQLRKSRSPEFESYSVFDQLLADRLADSVRSVSENMATRELSQMVFNALSHLDLTDREIVELRHVESMTFRKIAEIVDLPFETAKKRYYRALDEIKEHVGALS